MFGSAEKFCYLGIMIEENGLENTKKKGAKENYKRSRRRRK